MYITIAIACDTCGGDVHVMYTLEKPTEAQIEAIRAEVPPVCGKVFISDDIPSYTIVELREGK